MEPNVRLFFIALLHCISLVIGWLLVVVITGLYFNFIFPAGEVGIYHFLYYSLALLSLAGVVYFIYKKWKNLPPLDDRHKPLY